MSEKNDQFLASARNLGAEVAFDGIAKTYRNVVAVEDLDFSIRAGEFFTLLGPSGSGKTTILNMVAGFIHPTKGEISIDGRPISSLPPERRDIGMVFQNYSLFPHMNVRENVCFPLKMRRVEKQRVEEMLNWALGIIGLQALSDRMPHELSGGQKQRVAFARAIVFNPRVLLMDEPLAALDLKLRERMKEELKNYQRMIGCTVVYVTHDQGEAMALSDRVGIMNEGCLIQVGTPQEIYNRPNSRFAAEFIGETNLFSRDEIEDLWGREGEDILRASIGQSENLNGVRSVDWLLIRPEKMRRWSPREPADAARLSGVVQSVTFLGEHSRYHVLLKNGRTIVFKESTSPGAEEVQIGDEVSLSFNVSDASHLAE